MNNRRAQFMGLGILFITIFLCTVSIALYFVQQDNSYNSLISPREVLAVQMDLEVFEALEMEIIKESLLEGDGKFGSEEFVENFRDSLLSNKNLEDNLKEILFEDLVVEAGKSLPIPNNFISEGLYPRKNFKNSTEGLVLIRGDAVKEFRLKVEREGGPKINFPVNFVYEFGREYLINIENGEYTVEKR